ncbi:MAG: cytochrome c [Verrucomicrobiota bacterium]
MSDSSDKNLDYSHRPSVANAHSREKSEPGMGSEGIPFSAIIVAAIVLLAGGSYLVAHTPFDSPDSIYTVAEYTPEPRPKVEGMEVEQLTWGEKWLKDGKRSYNNVCGACHKPDGTGQAGVGIPPLVSSSWVTEGNEQLVQIVLGGLSGPIEVNGTNYGSAVMPPQASLTDKQIAQVLSYVRREFGEGASFVTEDQVAAGRAKHGSRTTPWTAGELINADLPGTPIDEENGEPLSGGEPGVEPEAAEGDVQ